MMSYVSKLNPSAQEFVPSSRGVSANSLEFVARRDFPRPIALDGRSHFGTQPCYNYQSKIRRFRIKDRIKCTVFVSQIDRSITEAELVTVLSICGPVKECRICGDTKSGLRFGFIEYEHKDFAKEALLLDGTRIGQFLVRVTKSRSAIVPVNPTLLPQSEEEKEMVSRTVFCTNINKAFNENDLKEFFESRCGEVSRIKLLNDYGSDTRNAFLEFTKDEFAVEALERSGTLIGNLNIRVIPSKTPIRTRDLNQSRK